LIHGHRVLDAHVHLQPSHTAFPDTRATFERGRSDVEELRAFEADASRFEAHLAREGIDAAVLVNYVSPVVMGYPPATNDWVAAYAKGRPGLVPMGSVHPDATPDVRAEVERVLSLGVRALKVHPAHQLLYPNDERLAPLYEVAERRRVPVTIHTGTSVFPRARNRFTDPLFVDDVAVEHPKLTILLAHAGRPLWYETASFLARRHENVLLELSGIPPKKLLDVLPRLPDLSHKCVWGSDWPSMGVRSLRANVEEFLKLPLSDAAKRAILWENGARVFGLAPQPQPQP
jgi:predicted TIM-barrel fold metal-dependent hydrolase